MPLAADGVLAVISHGHVSEAPTRWEGRPALRIAVPPAHTRRQVEVWRTGRDVESGSDNGLVFGHDGHYLFCGGQVRHDDDYLTAVETVYLRILGLTADMGYPDIARVWNVVGGITEPVDSRAGTDRYSLFCQARARAFARRSLQQGTMPAATGIGGYDSYTTVYLLATRSREVVRLENPRQVPAYEYPGRYGIQAPSFARAAYVRPGGSANGGGSGDLFVSGTASIVGHETVHRGDVEEQTRTTLENIEALVSGANLRRHRVDADVALSDLDWVKVYVKHRRDVEAVRRICGSVLGPGSQVAYTIADVCREDLLVEIEAFASVPERNRQGQPGRHSRQGTETSGGKP
jgi:chorismate lyase / 3-hydroxybenzoate synthase